MLLSLVIISLLTKVITALNLPSAPYHVKVFCRQGRRFSRTTQTPIQCPSSSTSCGYIEFPSPDRKIGLENTGVYECVDSGMISTTMDVDNKNNHLFAALCGPIPQCSSLHIDSLSPSFAKYIITTYEIELETLTSRTLRFCCSLFHSTLQKLINSGMDKLPSSLAPPVHCLSEICAVGAVGCLLHTSMDSEEEYDGVYEDRIRIKKQTDDYDGVNTMQLSFDYEEDSESFEFVSNVPATTPIHTGHSSNQPPEIISNSSTTLETLHYQDYDNTDAKDEMHCVYRHLNDEFYRYCLMVHQRKDGDRCYHYKGHTICCCFVPPDQETCDPTELDLVRPPPPTRMPLVKVTALTPSTRISYSVKMPQSTTLTTETRDQAIFSKETTSKMKIPTTNVKTTIVVALTTVPIITSTRTPLRTATTPTTAPLRETTIPITTSARTETTSMSTTTSTTKSTTTSTPTTTASTTFKKTIATNKLIVSPPNFTIRKTLNRRCRITYSRSKTQRGKGQPILICDTSSYLTNHIVTLLACSILLLL